MIVILPVSAQYFDTPGLRQEFFVETGGYEFLVETTSNYNIEEVELSVEEKKLTFYIKSGLQNNLGEMTIPVNLINGNFTFFLNDQEFFPVVKYGEEISFITVEFEGDGRHKLEIIGTTYLPEFSEIARKTVPPWGNSVPVRLRILPKWNSRAVLRKFSRG